MKKRILSILLTLCMVMCAISPVMSYADPGASASGAYGALLTPDTTPPVGWAEDESNPYGTKKGQPFAITPWYEPIIYSYRNAETGGTGSHQGIQQVDLRDQHCRMYTECPQGFCGRQCCLLLSEQLTIRSARAETITPSLSVFAI